MGAVIGFFSFRSAKVSKKGNISSAAQAVLLGRHDKSEGAVLLPEPAPGELGCALCSATLPPTSGPHCLNLANEGFFCGFA